MDRNLLMGAYMKIMAIMVISIMALTGVQCIHAENNIKNKDPEIIFGYPFDNTVYITKKDVLSFRCTVKNSGYTTLAWIRVYRNDVLIKEYERFLYWIEYLKIDMPLDYGDNIITVQAMGTINYDQSTARTTIRRIKHSTIITKVKKKTIRKTRNYICNCNKTNCSCNCDCNCSCRNPKKNTKKVREYEK